MLSLDFLHKLDKKLVDLNLSLPSRYILLTLCLKADSLNQPFRVLKKGLNQELGLQIRQIERHLTHLEELGLIHRTYSTFNDGTRAVGNSLYITINSGF